VKTEAARRTALFLFTILISLSVSALETANDPLTTEAVVKLWVSGTPMAEIIARIEAGDAEFDLPPEIVEELTVVGLPVELLRAMQARQVTVERDAEAAREAAFVTGERFGFRLNPGQKKSAKRQLVIHDEVSIPLLHQWRLDPGVHFEDVALFVACSTADHVPDHWRSKTPLYWKSSQMPRHRMLVMRDGASWAESTLLTRIGIASPDVPTNEDGTPAPVNRPVGVGGAGLLVLGLPPALETTLVPGVAHDLHLGIALKVDGRLYPWTFSTLNGVVLEGGPLELDATIRGLKSRLEAIEIRFGDDAQAKYDARTVCTMGCPRP